VSGKSSRDFLEQPDFETSSSQMLDLLERHPRVREHVNIVARFSHRAEGAVIAAVSYLVSLSNKKLVAEFNGATPDSDPEAVHLHGDNDKVTGVNAVPYGTTLPTPPPSDHTDSRVRPGV
jgi:hypothetical protein